MRAAAFFMEFGAALAANIIAPRMRKIGANGKKEINHQQHITNIIQREDTEHHVVNSTNGCQTAEVKNHLAHRQQMTHIIDHGQRADGPSPRTMDWEQDAGLIFSAVNRAAGFEVRSAKYIHWWTFVGYFMEIKDSTYATVLGLRGKRARGKKLEKGEQEFWNQNRGICELKKRYTEEELEEQERLKAILGG